MVSVGFSDDIDLRDANLAPNFELSVNGHVLSAGMHRLVRSVEYESADGVAEVCKVTLLNRDFALTDKMVFQAGNEISVALGYGASNLKHVGRAVIANQVPDFPRSEEPTLEVVAYTKDKAMADHSPEKAKPDASPARGKRKSSGRVFTGVRYSEAVTSRARDYGFIPDVDDTPGVHTFVQKAGMTDYELVRGLAGITGFLFWVDGDEDGQWTLHFRDPEKSSLKFQDRKYTLNYNSGDASSLLAFRPEYLVSGFNTKIRAVVKNTRTGKLMDVTEEEGEESQDVQYTGDPEESAQESHKSAGAIKLYFNDFSFDVIANKTFETEQDVRDWVRQWFRRQRENFVLAEGETIGVETLAARQVHAISGVGKSLSGDYYFSRVRHKLVTGTGYTCEFSARKVVT